MRPVLCNSGRVPSYLLRIELVDRPGSLGSLAVALGSVGADILSLDVVERSRGHAIDDLVIELPPGAMPDTLITAAESLPGVRVDSVRPHTGLLEAHRELELLDHVAAADVDSPGLLREDRRRPGDPFAEDLLAPSAAARRQKFRSDYGQGFDQVFREVDGHDQPVGF